MNRHIHDAITMVRQRLSDWCETRMHKAKGIRAEQFWFKLSWWVLMGGRR